MFSRLFHIGGQKVLGMYSNRKGVVYAEPQGTSHLAHVIWKNPLTGKDSNIDYFLAKDSKLKPSEARMIKPQADKGAEDKFQFRYQLLSSLKDFEWLARDIAVADVNSFIESRIALHGSSSERRLLIYLDKNKGSKMHSEIVDTVKGASEVSFYGHAAIQTIGKQDYYPGCLLDLNLDFARWCSSGITPDGKLAPWNSCEYCYASHMHTGYPAAFAVEKDNLIKQINEARIAREAEGKPTRYMRLGKRTECGSPIFRKNLINTLEACAEEGIKCIFPTKFLEFDKEVAKLLKKTDSTLLVSLGSNELEPGAVLHGRTQEARIAEGIKYLEAGIRVVPYVIVDAALPNGGKYFEKNLAEAKEKFPRIQILPIRLRHRERAVKILGGWHDLLKSNTGQLDLFGKPDGKYESGGDHTRIAVDIHSSLTDLINNNCGSTRMCHHSSCAEYCGMCFMPGEKPFSRKV